MCLPLRGLKAEGKHVVVLNGFDWQINDIAITSYSNTLHGHRKISF